MSYINHISLILCLLQSVKTNNYELYAETLCQMQDLFFSFGGMNYARYLTFFGVHLMKIEHSHPGATELLRSGAFSVARSLTPGNRSAVDKTMEETFMKHAKSRGGTAAGIVGLTKNYEAYQRSVRTSHERVKYVQRVLELTGLQKSEETYDIHREIGATAICKSEDSVQRAMTAIESFTNPFSVEASRLVSLSSGATVPPEVEKDVLDAEKIGKEQKDAFIKERLVEKKKVFLTPYTN